MDKLDKAQAEYIKQILMIKDTQERLLCCLHVIKFGILLTKSEFGLPDKYIKEFVNAICEDYYI